MKASRNKFSTSSRIESKDPRVTKHHHDSSTLLDLSSEVTDSDSSILYPGSDEDDVIDVQKLMEDIIRHNANTAGQNTDRRVAKATDPAGFNITIGGDREGCTSASLKIPRKPSGNEAMKTELSFMKQKKIGGDVTEAPDQTNPNRMTTIRALLRGPLSARSPAYVSACQSMLLSNQTPSSSQLQTSALHSINHSTKQTLPITSEEGTPLAQFVQSSAAQAGRTTQYLTSQSSQVSSQSIQLSSHLGHVSSQLCQVSSHLGQAERSQSTQASSNAHMQTPISQNTEVTAPIDQQSQANTLLLPAPAMLDMRLMQPVPSRETVTFLQDLCTYYTELLKQPNPYAAKVAMTPYCHCQLVPPYTPIGAPLDQSIDTPILNNYPSGSPGLELLGTLRADMERVTSRRDVVDMPMANSDDNTRVKQSSGDTVKKKKRKRPASELLDPSLFCCPCHPRSSGSCQRCHGPDGVCNNCRNKNCRFKKDSGATALTNNTELGASRQSDVRIDVMPTLEQFMIRESIHETPEATNSLKRQQNITH